MFQALKDGVGYWRSFKPNRTDGLDLSYIPFSLTELTDESVGVDREGETHADRSARLRDLSRLIAMCGFSKGAMDTLIRNTPEEVSIYLDHHHKDHFRIYNLTEHAHSDSVRAMFHNNCRHFPIPDHNVPKFDQLLKICQDIDAFLNDDPLNRAVVHCKAGKGRTGTIICAYLLFSGACETVADASRVFATARSDVHTTANGTRIRRGVDQASQLRWLHYFRHLIGGSTPIERFRPLQLARRTLLAVHVLVSWDFDLDYSIPFLLVKDWGLKGGLPGQEERLLARVVAADGELLRHQARSAMMRLSFTIPESSAKTAGVILRGETKIELWEEGTLRSPKRIARAWIHPYFVEADRISLKRIDIDDVWNSTDTHKFPRDFGLQFLFAPTSTNTVATIATTTTSAATPTATRLTQTPPALNEGYFTGGDDENEETKTGCEERAGERKGGTEKENEIWTSPEYLALVAGGETIVGEGTEEPVSVAEKNVR